MAPRMAIARGWGRGAGSPLAFGYCGASCASTQDSLGVRGRAAKQASLLQTGRGAGSPLCLWLLWGKLRVHPSWIETLPSCGVVGKPCQPGRGNSVRTVLGQPALGLGRRGRIPGVGLALQAATYPGLCWVTPLGSHGTSRHAVAHRSAGRVAWFILAGCLRGKPGANMPGNCRLTLWEFPRLCRGGSRSLTFTGVCLGADFG